MSRYLPKGAGGSSGGIGHFFLGLTMWLTGSYLLLQSIVIQSSFHLGLALYRFSLGGWHGAITSGMILIPFIFGIAMIFYNARNWLAWGLVWGSLGALIFGVISSLSISMRSMTAFELLTILTLTFGGFGLFLRSLREGG